MSTSASSPAASKRPKSIASTRSRASRARAASPSSCKGGRVADVKLRIYEPPRFFEAFLRGRALHRGARHHGADLRHLPGRLPDELDPRDGGGAAASTVTGPLRALRRLLYCGEWIECHALHVYMLHAPDFLGYESAIHMAKDHAEAVKKALELKKIGNDIVALVGGREIHPINVRVGGFYRVPARERAAAHRPSGSRGARSTSRSRRWVRRGAFDFPDFEQDYEFVALRHPDEYPLNEGRVVSSRGLDIAGVRVRGALHRGARPALERAALGAQGRAAPTTSARSRATASTSTACPTPAQDAARGGRPRPGCRNPFKSIIVRAVELVFACRRGARASSRPTSRPTGPFVDVVPRDATRPRRLRGAARPPLPPLLDRRGRPGPRARRSSRPTAQNQKTIENDLWNFVPTVLDLPEGRAHAALRAGDPQLRPVHLVRDALPEAGPAAHLSNRGVR